MKKRNKVSAEFSMSSLTDIIFLLLIFFMLTSSLVTPNALNLKLPGKWSGKPSTTEPTSVVITKSGKYYMEGRTLSPSKIESKLRSKFGSGGGNGAITIQPDQGSPVESVVTIMDIAMRLQIDAVLASEPK